MDDCHLLQAAWTGAQTVGSPYCTALILCGITSVVTFVVSEATGNYSQVDKLWSILPVLYAWIPVGDDDDVRTRLMAILVTVWGVRLTHNFARRGGYHQCWPAFWKGDEDYRWAALQQGKLFAILRNRTVWRLFNLCFISFYQNVLLLLIVTPSFVAYTRSNCGGYDTQRELLTLDYVAALLMLVCIVVETIADNQQYAFQTEKYTRRKLLKPPTGEYADGFKQSGLFAVVRKPMYAAEQSIWISFFLFSFSATGWNWSCVGWILLCLLFQGSGWFTERLTKARYPKYEEYMRQVPLYVPNPFMFLRRDNNNKKGD